MKMFSAKVEEGRKGENGKPSVGPIYRNLLSENEFPPPHPEINTSLDVFSLAAEKFPENRMLGWCKIVDGKIGHYVWKTYKEVYKDVLLVGSALRASGVEPGSRIGVYGANCPQWIMVMEACNAHSLICVPLYDTLGPGAVNFIIDHAEVDVVFVQDKKVKELWMVLTRDSYCSFQLLSPDCTSSQRLKIIVCFTSLELCTQVELVVILKGSCKRMKMLPMV